jgi:hypothetical protein
MIKPGPLPPIDDKLRERLANGARLRAEMKRQIELGEEPQPAYRAQWLRESAFAIIRLLAERGEAFNAAHHEDGCSVADHLDAIFLARKTLLEQAAAWSEAMAQEPVST